LATSKKDNKAMSRKILNTPLTGRAAFANPEGGLTACDKAAMPGFEARQRQSKGERDEAL
jgi:hypothetical protein